MTFTRPSIATVCFVVGMAFGLPSPHFGFAASVVPAVSVNVPPRTLRVGEARDLRSISAAAAMARDGDIIEIDPGDYVADVAVWTQSDLTVRSSGGRVRLIAGGASAEGKAIWVARGASLRVENIEFSGARVRDRNGAGIRLERGRLVVYRCLFKDNENGILTSNDPGIELDVQESEFDFNGHGDGYSHHLYAGTIARLTVSGSYFHQARVGHLLKSRARESRVTYNRLTDEDGGRASYELEFPNGGNAFVVGNIIQQGARTENPVMVSFGAEGYAWQENMLYLVNNTLVDGRGVEGVFLAVAPGKRNVIAFNNLLLGAGRLESAGTGTYSNNPGMVPEDFASVVAHDYRLTPRARQRITIEDPTAATGFDVLPRREYVHPRRSRPISPPRFAGALQAGVAPP